MVSSSDLTKFLTEVIKEAAQQAVGEGIYIGTVRIMGSVENVARTLENGQIISTAAAENMGVLSNSVIIGMGVYTGGSSALQYGITTDKKAKACYAASTAFSASAIMSGGMAVMSRTCQISGTAAVSEMIGIAFLQLGNKAHVMALQMEGKPVPAKLRRFVDPTIRPVAFNSGGLGFVMPCPCPISSTFISSIPFEKIGKVVGFSLTAYGYYKIVVTGYSYSQKLISKFKEQRQKKLIKYRSTRLHRQAKFLVISFYHLPSVRRTLLIQRFATNNLVVHLG